jgi:GntR family transcriptional regulator
MEILTKSRRSTATNDVADQLYRAISGGAYSPGTKLPTEMEMVQAFQVSRATVREALRSLEEQGLIFRRHGVGTYVRSKPITKSLNNNYCTAEMISSAGFEPGTRVISLRQKIAGEDECEWLAVSPGTMMQVVERVRTADQQPVVYSLDIFAMNLAESIPGRLVNLGNRSIYEFFRNEMGIYIHHGIARIMAVKATIEIGTFLKLSPNTPLLYLRQIDYAVNEQPVMISHEYYAPDAFEVIAYRHGPGEVV